MMIKNNPLPNNPSRHVGIGMFIVGWIIFLAMLTWYFGLREDHRYNPNRQLAVSQQGETTEFVLQKNAFDQYIFLGTVNGASATFLVDTGANRVVVSSQLAQKAGLVSGVPVTVATAGGYTTAWQTTIHHLGIGPVELTNIQALINPSMPGNEVLLGMTALQHLNFRQHNDQLILSY